MPRKVRQRKVRWEDRPEPRTRGEAIESIQDGVTFFLKKKPVVTLLVLGGTLLGFIWGGSAYLADKREVRFEEGRKPLSEVQRNVDDGGLFVGSLYASSVGDQKPDADTLWINNKPWALIDRHLRVWKEYGKPSIVIRDMRDSLSDPLFMYVEGFDESNIRQQYKKAK